MPRSTPDGQLVATDHRTCFLRSDETICWGEPGNEQLFFRSGGGPEVLDDGGALALLLGGDPEERSFDRYPTVDAVEIAVGSSHLCARLPSGRIRCWAAPNVPFLRGIGDGVPVREDQTFVYGIEDARSIVAGTSHSCVIRASGDVVCWGVLPHAVGDADLGSSSWLNVFQAIRSTPSPIHGLGPAVQVAVAGSGTCSVLRSGSVRCMFADSGPPELAFTDPSLRDVTQIAVGLAAERPAACALHRDGRIACFNKRGTTAAWVPDIDDARALHGRNESFCAIRLDGSISCWTLDIDVGTSNLEVGAVHHRIAGVRNVEQLAVGAAHFCFLDQRDQIGCWGSDLFGELGGGHQAPVAAFTDVTDIFSTGGRVCVQDARSLSCLHPSDMLVYSMPIRARRVWHQDEEFYTWGEGNRLHVWSTSAVPLSDFFVPNPTPTADHLAPFPSARLERLVLSANSYDLPATPREVFPEARAFADQAGQWWSCNPEWQECEASSEWRNIRQVGPGPDRCALFMDDTIRCRDWNTYPGLRPLPVWLAEHPAVLVDVDVVHGACAQTEDRRVHCWLTGRREPISIPDLSDEPVDLDGSADYGCAVLRDGSVACWDTDRDHREVARRVQTLIELDEQGANTVDPLPPELDPYQAPTVTRTYRVDGVTRAVAVAVAQDPLGILACARTQESDVFCWGRGAAISALSGAPRSVTLSREN